MRLSAKVSKLFSRQFYDAIKFFENNTDQENPYAILYITEDSQQNEKITIYYYCY